MLNPHPSKLVLTPMLRLFLTLAVLAMGVWFGLQPVAAQEPEPAAQVATEAGSQTSPPAKELTLLQMYQLGGWAMHILLFGSVSLIGLVIFNLILLQRKRVLGIATYETLQNAAGRLDFATILETTRKNPCIFNNIVRAGFERANEAVSPSAIESGMEEAATEEVQKAMTTVGYLSVIAVVAPMVGLLGTVSGMIKAFRAMALGGMGRPELLADNISEALVTTAGGLIVGIPAMIAYFIFKSRLSAQIAMITRMGGDLMQRTKRGLRLFQEGKIEPRLAETLDITQPRV